jgi:hypothetical protein
VGETLKGIFKIMRIFLKIPFFKKILVHNIKSGKRGTAPTKTEMRQYRYNGLRTSAFPRHALFLPGIKLRACDLIT